MNQSTEAPSIIPAGFDPHNFASPCWVWETDLAIDPIHVGLLHYDGTTLELIGPDNEIIFTTTRGNIRAITQITGLLRIYFHHKVLGRPMLRFEFYSVYRVGKKDMPTFEAPFGYAKPIYYGPKLSPIAIRAAAQAEGITSIWSAILAADGIAVKDGGSVPRNFTLIILGALAIMGSASAVVYAMVRYDLPSWSIGAFLLAFLIMATLGLARLFT